MSICTACHDKIHRKEQPENTMIIRKKTTNGYMLKEVERENKIQIPWGSV